MWRKVFVCAVISLHISAQPLTETTEDGRDKRQLNFGECCPCPPRGGRPESAEDQFARPNSDAFSVIPTMDDCPCRPGRGDSDGAASIFFPTTMMRSNRPIDRPERKEDPKPLLHPEVDLAESVLKTLRDVTDEEYRDALERDAARSIARVAEDVLFADAHPQESAPKILTIVMNPRSVEDADDTIPEPSQIQESRCIHSPPAQNKPNLSMLRLPKLGDLKLSRTPPSSGILQRLFDRDSDVGASDVHEAKMSLHENSDTKELRTYAPTMRLRSDLSKRLNSKNLLHSPLSLDRFEKDGDLTLNALRNKHNIFDKLRSIPGINEKTTDSKLSLRNDALNKLFTKSSRVNMIDNKPLLQSDPDKNLFLNSPNLRAKNVNYGKELRVPKNHQTKSFKRFNDGEVNSINVNTEEVPKLEKTPFISRETEPVVSPSTMNLHLKKYQSNYHADDDPSQVTSKEAEDEDTNISPSEISPSVRNAQLDLLSNQRSNDECNTGTGAARDDDDLYELTREDGTAKESTIVENVTQMSNENMNNDEHHENNLEEERTNTCIEDIVTMNDRDAHLPEMNKSEESNSETNLSEQSSDSGEKPNSFGQLRENDNDNSPCDETIPTPLEVRDADEKSFEENAVNDTNCSGETDLVNSPSNVDTVATNKSYEGTEKDSSCDDDSQNSDLTTKDDKYEPNTLINDSKNAIGTPITTVKENIMKKLETIRNAAQDIINKHIFDKKSPTAVASPVLTSREAVDSDCDKDNTSVIDLQKQVSQNEGLDNNLVSSTTPSSVEDIKEMSKSNIANCDEELQETSTILPRAADVERHDCEDFIEQLHSSQPVTEKDLEVQDISNNLKNCLDKEPDSKTQASETVLSRVPLNSENYGTNLLLRDTTQTPSNILQRLTNTLKIPDIHEVLKKSEDIVPVGLKSNLFNGIHEQKNSLKSVLDKNPLNIINPLMVADSSKTDFRSTPLERQSILDSSKINLKPLKAHLPLLEDLSINPLNLQPLKIGDDVFGLNFDEHLKNGMNNLKSTLAAPLKINHFDNGLFQPKESRKILDIVTPLKNKNTLKDSGFGIVPNDVLAKKSQDLLETISRNHEDMNEKLRAIHIDFNDRIDSMRNNLMDKWYSNEPRNKGILKSSNSRMSTQNGKKIKSPKSSQIMETRQRNSKLLPNAEERISKPSSLSTKHRDNHKIKTPGVTSPRTLHAPEIRSMPVKSLKLPSPKTSNINPSIHNIGSSRASPSLSTIKSKAPETPKNKLKLFRESKITMTMPTTPIPKIMKKSNRDPSGSPSENINAFSRPSLASKSNDDFKETPSKHPQVTDSRISYKPLKHDTDLNTNPKMVSAEARPRDSVQPRKINSWPDKNDSAFLAKVREALQTRRLKDNSKIASKPSNLRSNEEVKLMNTDMARSASENFNLIEGEPLKENVGYTCRLVCTKDSSTLKD